MPRRKHTPEQILRKLRLAEVQLAEGATVQAVCRSLEVTKQTDYRWRRKYGGMQVSQARRLRELEKENQRLRRLVADQALDNAILREAAKGDGPAGPAVGRWLLGCRRPSASRSAGSAAC